MIAADLQVLREVNFGLVVYEHQPIPASTNADAFTRLLTGGHLVWQSVIWSSMRIAVLSSTGMDALSGR
jgi:hypothetical protein